MDFILFEKTSPEKAGFPFISVNNRNLSFISHYHKEIEIIYVSEGSITLFSGKREFILSEGEFCIFMPYEIHGFRTVTPNRLCLAKISPETYEENLCYEKLYLDSPILSPDKKGYFELKHSFSTMIDEYLTRKTGYEYAVRQHQNSILLTIYRNMPLHPADTSKDISLLNTINVYLEENYSKKLELEELANFCHLSKYYFAHKFKEITGMSFVSYLTQFRLEKAMSLLKETNESITDIALNCGFGSLRSFDRCFISSYKTTPLKYRKEK